MTMLLLYDHYCFVFSQGCVEEIKQYAKEHMLIIGGIAIGVGAIQVGFLPQALALWHCNFMNILFSSDPISSYIQIKSEFN